MVLYLMKIEWKIVFQKEKVKNEYNFYKFKLSIIHLIILFEIKKKLFYECY